MTTSPHKDAIDGVPTKRRGVVNKITFDVGRMKALYKQALYDGCPLLLDFARGALVIAGDVSEQELDDLRDDVERTLIADYQEAIRIGLPLLAASHAQRLRREFQTPVEVLFSDLAVDIESRRHG